MCLVLVAIKRCRHKGVISSAVLFFPQIHTSAVCVCYLGRGSLLCSGLDCQSCRQCRRATGLPSSRTSARPAPTSPHWTLKRRTLCHYILMCSWGWPTVCWKTNCDALVFHQIWATCAGLGDDLLHSFHDQISIQGWSSDSNSVSDDPMRIPNNSCVLYFSAFANIPTSQRSITALLSAVTQKHHKM